MYGFTHADVAETTPLYTIWRRGDVMCIRVLGIVDDAKSEEWRSGFMRHIERKGCPRFATLDSTGSDPHNSLKSRLASATFGRDMARRLEWGAVLVGSSPGPLVVVKTVMRVIGMPNIYVFQTAAELTAAHEACRSGRRPARWGATAEA